MGYQIARVLEQAYFVTITSNAACWFTSCLIVQYVKYSQTRLSPSSWLII